MLQILNKQPDLATNRVTQLLEIYKILLLYKTKSDTTNKLAETFVKILKRVIN